jgi:phosphate transport system substrate-binding protein
LPVLLVRKIVSQAIDSELNHVAFLYRTLRVRGDRLTCSGALSVAQSGALTDHRHYPRPHPLLQDESMVVGSTFGNIHSFFDMGEKNKNGKMGVEREGHQLGAEKRGHPMVLARKARILLQIVVWMAMVARPAAAQEAISLVGSGSNLVSPLYSAWTAQYAKLHSNVHVNFLSLGTSQSLQEISAGTGDFGGGEIPLNEVQKHGGKYTLTQFPTLLVAIEPIYKLPGKPELRFSAEMLAGIFLGDIRNWNDPRIAKLNPGVDLPDLAITVVHLSGVKGSNYILTDFLSRTSVEWKAKVGKSASPKWPVGVETNRSEGLVTKVSATPGAIGYVELSYVKGKNVGSGSVQNTGGQFVKPTTSSILAACAASEKLMPEDLGASLVNAAGRESYPIVSFTWIYVPTKSQAPARSAALKDFWNWALSDGQQIAGEMGYTVLPLNLALKARDVVSSIR